MLTEHDYYNPHDLLSRNAMFNFIVAGRGRGKTYAYKQIGIQNNIKKREEFIYLRRWDTELKDKGTFFDDIKPAFPNHDFRVNGTLGEIRDHCEDDKQPCKQHKWRTLCYFQALSKAGNVKSVPYPNVTTIIFDEIFSNNNRYLPAEVEAFQEYYSTVDRWKDKTRVYFLSNAVNLANPYFLQYDITPRAHKRFTFYHNRYILLENVDAGGFALKVKQTRFGQFIQNQEYAQYAINNEFRDDNNELVDRPAQRLQTYLYTLHTDMTTLHIYSTINTRDHLPTYHINKHAPKKQPTLDYCTQAQDVTTSKTLLTRHDPQTQTIISAYRNGRITFDSAQTRSAFLAYIKTVIG